MATQAVSPIWLRQVATALSSRYNVAIREGNNWSMDIENRVMTYRADHLLALDRDTCLGILLHELAHLHFTTNKWSEKSKLFKQMPKITHNAVNAFEDVRINEKMSQSYMGSRDLINAMNELLAGDGVEHIMRMDKEIRERGVSRGNNQMEEWREIFYIAMVKLLGNYFPQITPDMYYDEKKLTIINEIVREAELQDLKNMKSTEVLYKFIETHVFPKIQDYLPKPSDDGNDSNESADGQQSDSNGQGNDDGSDNSDSTNQNNKSDSNSDSSTDDGDSQDGESDDSGGDGDSGDGDKKEDKSDSASRGGTGVGTDDWKKELENKIKKAIKRGRVNPDTNHRTEPFSKNGNEVPPQHIAETCNVEKHMETSRTLQRQFKNKFEAVFRDNQYAREQVGQKSGRLNNRVLHKHRLGNTRLFKKKIEQTKKSYAVTFALDLSGSMQKPQVVGSFYAMLAFTETLKRLDIPHAVGFFSSYCTIGKSFDKPMVEKRMSIEASKVNNGGTNPEKLILGLVGKELMAQNVKERVAIFLTDGMWNYNSYEELRHLKKRNPKLHIYVVPLMLHPDIIKLIEVEIGNVCTILEANTPEEIMDKYIAIAKKHLI